MGQSNTKSVLGILLGDEFISIGNLKEPPQPIPPGLESRRVIYPTKDLHKKTSA